LAQALGLDSGGSSLRLDLMPSDITGTDINRGDPTTRPPWTRAGPIFSNVLLADESNRTPPKTHRAARSDAGALLHRAAAISTPFVRRFCARHAEPDRVEGTYPLPEAQLDRFIFNVLLDYLSADQRIKVRISPPPRTRAGRNR